MKILVIKTSALGDIVHTFPAVEFIQEVVPEAEIEWVVEKSCAPLVADLYKTLEIDTKEWRKNIFRSWGEMRQAIAHLRKNTYDVAFDFQGNIKSGIILALTKAKLKVGFGKKSVHEKPNLLFTHLQIDPEEGLNIRQDYLALVEGWAKQKKVFPPMKVKTNSFAEILVCPGSKWPNKQLPLDTLTQFLQDIQEKQGSKFWILQGNEEEKKCAESIKAKLQHAEVLETLSLPQLRQFMQQMDCVIAMDSLPLHLAGEVGVPTFSLFGSSSQEKFRPMGEIHRSVQGTCPYQRTFKKRCPVLRTCPTGACIKNLKSSQIASEFFHE